MSQPLLAEIRPHRGALSLHLNGQVQPSTSYKITETPDTAAMLASAAAEIPGLARQGIRHCWLPVFVNWDGPGQYDFSDLDRRVTEVLRLFDEHRPAGGEAAVIVVRIQAATFSPPWYIEQDLDAQGRPTNLIEFRTPWGPAEPAPYRRELRYWTRWPDYSTAFAISPGDEFWDTHALDCLRATVQHVWQQPWAHRVYGWLPCAFCTNEWFIFSDAPESTCDFSRPTQAAFARHLREQGLPSDEAPVPAPAVGQQGEALFLDPAQPGERRVEEFSRWLNQRIVGIISRFARTIREHDGPGRRLVGVFYGYTSELSRVHHLAQSGHLGLQALLANPDLDFFCSPGQYRFRGDDKPFTFSQVLGGFANSAALHGKLAYLEDDHQPVCHPVHCRNFTTRDAWHDEMFYRRNLGQVLTHGQALWWYSLSPQWIAEPARQELLGRLQRVAVAALERDRTPVAEIAVVADERTVSAMRLNPALHQALLLQSYALFHPLGAPFEFHELHSFLGRADHARFKVVLFLNLFLADAATRAAVDRLKGGGRTLLFQQAPGLAEDTAEGRTATAALASRMVGMALQEEPIPPALTVWVDPERTALLPGAPDLRYGWLEANKQVTPVLSVADPLAEPLGWLPSGAIGLARRRHAQWTSVFSSAPQMPTELLRRLCLDAGVHVYCSTGEVVYANRSLVVLVASSRGEKRLALPGGTALQDALTGERLPLDGDHACRLVMKRHETRLFWRLD
jgi:hypothetical protein